MRKSLDGPALVFPPPLLRFPSVSPPLYLRSPDGGKTEVERSKNGGATEVGRDGYEADWARRATAFQIREVLFVIRPSTPMSRSLLAAVASLMV